MMKGIIQAFKENVNDVGWIDNKTVEAVRDKVISNSKMLTGLTIKLLKLCERR